MIDYASLAEEAGFGGVLRRTLAARIKILVDLAVAKERQACSDLCTEHGDLLKHSTEDDFKDGQMDGAYQCAELILRRN